MTLKEAFKRLLSLGMRSAVEITNEFAFQEINSDRTEPQLNKGFVIVNSRRIKITKHTTKITKP